MGASATKVAAIHMAKTFQLNVGDPVLFGKYKNKKGVIKGFKTDEKSGDAIVIIEPVPKGRKQDKEIKLFKIRYDEVRAEKEKTAGMFEAPPGLLEAYLKWAIPIYAGNALYYAEARLEAMRDASKPIKDALAEIERIRRTWQQDVERLGPDQKVTWTIPWPLRDGTVASYAAGVKNWGRGLKGETRYLFDQSQKRVTFRKRRAPRTLDRVKSDVEYLLNQATRHFQGFLQKAEQKGSDDTSLVEYAMLVRELKKLTPKAKHYRTTASFKMPITAQTLQGWKYRDSLPPDGEIARLLAENGWGDFKVILGFKHHVSRGGVWFPHKKELQVDQPVVGGDHLVPDTVPELREGLAGLAEIARHEFQHVGQSLFETLTGADEVRGLPPKFMRDPTKTPAGHRRDISPTSPWNPRDPHALQDVEFYTGLADEVVEFRKLTRRVPRQRLREVFDIWTGNQKGFISKDEFGVAVSPSSYFSTLLRENKAKWRKAVGEFVKEIEKAGVRVPSSSRVASLHLAQEGLLPIMDPLFNVREMCKQLALLEDHLQIDKKRCLDCIRKHLLTAESLAEEAISLDMSRRYYAVLQPLPDKLREMWGMVQDKKYLETAAASRKMRKPLMLLCSTVRVANAHLEREAGMSEWLQWIVQPFDVLRKHHKKFISGPLDDATDAVIKEIAPSIVKAVVAQEVNEDVDEYLEGAQEGRFDSLAGHHRSPKSGTSDDFKAGYAWGYNNAMKWDGRDLPASHKREVVQTQIQEFRGQITEQVVIAALEKAWATVNPQEIFRTVMRAVKRHGWKLGLIYAIGELIENLVIPAALSAITGIPFPPGSMAWLPLNDIVFAVIVKRLGSAGAVDEFEEEGHLGWYESRYGPVRIACLQR